MTPGTYPAVVESHGLDKTQSGMDYAYVRFTVEGQEGPETISARINFPIHSEKAMRMARKSLKAIGFDPDSLTTSELQNSPELLRGHECEIVVDVDDYRGDGSLCVKYINAKREPVTGDAMKPIDAALRAVASKPKRKASAPSEMDSVGDLAPEDAEKPLRHGQGAPAPDPEGDEELKF